MSVYNVDSSEALAKQGRRSEGAGANAKEAATGSGSGNFNGDSSRKGLEPESERGVQAQLQEFAKTTGESSFRVIAESLSRKSKAPKFMRFSPARSILKQGSCRQSTVSPSCVLWVNQARPCDKATLKGWIVTPELVSLFAVARGAFGLEGFSCCWSGAARPVGSKEQRQRYHNSLEKELCASGTDRGRSGARPRRIRFMSLTQGIKPVLQQRLLPPAQMH